MLHVGSSIYDVDHLEYPVYRLIAATEELID